MKLRKLFATATMALLVGASVTAEAVSVKDVRIYINPGHGAFAADCRPMGTVKHGANQAYDSADNDTTNFFESNTNLQKALALLGKLESFGVPFDHTKNQTNENPHRVGAALDLTQNIVMSHVKCGGYPAYSDYTAHTENPDNIYYDRSLSVVAAEVEFNDFDLFVSIHSNAATDGTNTNYPLILYRGTDALEGNPGSIDVAKAVWPYLYGQGHHQWTYYSMTKTNIRGDMTFYGSSSNAIMLVPDDYVWDENHNHAVYIPTTEGPDTVKYTGYLGVLKHGVKGFLAEGYFHTYQPARHRYMNDDVAHLEGVAYARGIADYFGWDKKETTGTVYGIVRDLHQKFTHEFYKPNVTSNDKFKPLNNVTVTLKNESGVVKTYTTDDEWNGAFVFDVEPGTYTIECTHEEYKADLYTKTNKSAQPEVVTVTVEKGKCVYPEIFLERVDYVPPTIVYVNYPDSLEGKTGFNLYPSYELKATNYNLLADSLVNKTVRRQLVRDNKQYVLAIDAANKPYVYVADLKAGTVTKLGTSVCKTGADFAEGLALADITMTADGYLLGCNYNKTTYNPTETYYVYKWENDINGVPAGEAIELFKSQTSALYLTGRIGLTISYSGTLENGYLIATVMHDAGNFNKHFRFAGFPIADEVATAPNSMNTYAETSPWNCVAFGEIHSLVPSPFYDETNDGAQYAQFIMDGNASLPTEFQTDGGQFKDNTILSTFAKNLVSEKAVSGSYFKYNGKIIFVTPDVNNDGKVVGIKAFDVTGGLDTAKEIALDGAKIEATDYNCVSAHGELALKLSADDITEGATIELFLVIDGKVVKFVETETYTTTTPATGTANPFAYALSSKLDGETLKVNYSLNTDATAVNVNVKDAEGAVVATASGAVTKGAQSVNVDISKLNDGSYTWEVEVAGAAKTAIETFKSYRFYHPRGVDVDNNMESPAFGNVYVTEGMVTTSADYWSGTGGGLGLYIFTPDMEGVKNEKTGKYAFTGGWTLNPKANSKNTADLARVRVAEDGRIFVTRMNDTGDYIMFAKSQEDLVANDKFTSLLAGATFDASTYKYTNSNGDFLTAANLGFDVKGSGEDLKLLALSSNKNHWSYVYTGGSTDEIALGTADAITASTNIPALSGKYTISPATTNVEYDNRGGIWYCQYRSAPKDTEPSLVYINEDGEEMYKDITTVRGGAGVRVSPDGTQIAVSSSTSQFTIYNLVWTEDGVPGLRREYVITHGIGTNVYDIAWDLAGNIYICGNSKEYLKGFALPRTKAFATQAASKYAFKLGATSIEDVEVEETEAPVEYYNLQGVKVDKPEHGIFIKKQGSKATKVVL